MPVFIGQSFKETFEEGITHLAGWNPPAAFPWFTTNSLAYEGSYSLRSAYLGANQTSDMNVSVTSSSVDSVSFYYRVSSEANYDKFFFLIDGTEEFNASGDIDWTRAAYALPAGSHTLTFRYSKDGSVNNGSDCAWIDNVILPHQTHPVTFLHRDTCLSSTETLQTIVQSSNQAVTIIDYIAHPSYNVTDEIMACDSLLWQGQSYTASTVFSDSLLTAYGCDSLVTLTLTVNHSTVGDTLSFSTQASSFEWYGTVYDSSGTYQQALVNSQGCDSLVTLILSIGSTQQGISETNDLPVSIYPNPATRAVTVNLPGNEAVLVSIMDLNGRTLREFSTLNSQFSIDISTLPSGTYLLRLTLPETTVTRRIIKQ